MYIMHYHNITKCDMLNGDGLRVVLWVSGCSHHCEGCHNPETWNPDSGISFLVEDREELFEALDKDYIAGLTLSGGDPLFIDNRETTLSIAKEFKERFPSKTLWVYTGYLFEEVKDLEIMKYVDVLVDGPFMLDFKDDQLMWKGSSNQRVIDVQESLQTGTIVLHCLDYEESPSNVIKCKGCGE